MRDINATIAALTAHPGDTALLVDFDGSLSPIVEHPAEARALPEAVTQLERLAARLGRVAIVSGRPVSFLTAQVPLADVTFCGLYGMEHFTGGIRTVDPSVVPHLDAVRAATSELARRFPSEVVESKAGVSVTLHWRPVPARADEIREAAREVAQRFGLRELSSRMAVELRPPVELDKGTAARALIDGFDVAAFAGDDTGDLAAFAALERARETGQLRDAIRIGVDSAEAPPELAASVDVLVDGPEGLAALLARVADQIA